MPTTSNRRVDRKVEHKTGLARSRPSPAPASSKTAATAKRPSPADHKTHEITVTIPADKIFSTAADIVTAPLAIAGRVLPAKGGILLYAGLGVLAIAEIIEWPVAVAAGAGYALARRWTPARTQEKPQPERQPKRTP